MDIAAYIFIGLTALFHVGFFIAESIRFMEPKTLKKFDLDSTKGAIIKPWAFNQGFYNLFLALGLGYSLILFYMGKVESGLILASYLLLYIVCAGVVLRLSVPKYKVFALIQAVPAAFGLIALIMFQSGI